MIYLRWALGIALVALFLLCIVCNVAYVLGWILRQRRSSLVLIVGGMAGLIGFFVVPVKVLNKWFWLPPIADFAVPYGLYLTLQFARRVLARSG
jgi:hypothetical protein